VGLDPIALPGSRRDIERVADLRIRQATKESQHHQLSEPRRKRREPIQRFVDLGQCCRLIVRGNRIFFERAMRPTTAARVGCARPCTIDQNGSHRARRASD